MKNDIHPDYHDVVFLDTSTGAKILTRSTMTSSETTELDGETYPLVKVEISSASHPFYTGKMKYVDSAGRVEKFQKKYKWGQRGQQGTDEKAAAEPDAKEAAET